MKKPNRTYPRPSGIKITLTARAVLHEKQIWRIDGEIYDVAIERLPSGYPYKIVVGCQTMYASDSDLTTLRRLIDEARRM